MVKHEGDRDLYKGTVKEVGENWEGESTRKITDGKGTRQTGGKEEV